MKTLLFPSLSLYGTRVHPYIPLGALSLQASAQAEGFDVDIALSILKPAKLQSIDDIINHSFSNYRPIDYDLIGFSSVCDTFHYMLTLCKKAKEANPNALIVIGGPHPNNFAPQILNAFPFIDAVFEGEAESAFVHFIKHFNKPNDRDNYPGIVTRSSKLKISGVYQDLDRLPSISLAKDFLPSIEIVERHLGHPINLPLESTRGCPMQCSFCSTRLMWGQKVRRRSSSALRNEMQKLSNLCGERDFDLVGDNFSAPIKNFRSFIAELLETPLPSNWGASMKLDRINKKDLEILWKVGCRSMFVGIESASQSTLTLAKKHVNLNHELDLVFHAIEMGFNVETSFIVGFPWETYYDIKATYALHCRLLKSGAKRSQVCVMCPIPGTEIIKHWEIVHDRINSSLAQSAIAMGEDITQYVNNYKEFFTYLGRYKTENLSPVELDSVYQASLRMTVLYEKWADRKIIGGLEMSTTKLTDDWRGANIELSYKPNLVIDGVELEQVIGENNFQDPWFLRKGYEKSRSVCCIPSLGTGFLITKDIIMTNWHVFRRKEWAKNKNIIFNYEKNENGIIQNEEIFILQPEKLFHSNEALDYAICAVENQPGQKYGWIDLTQQGIAREKARVNIIQHPGAEAKKMAIRDNIMCYADENILQYLTDTEHGSSGSPVFDDRWGIIGLHYRNQTVKDEETGGKINYNEAHAIEAIYNQLESYL